MQKKDSHQGIKQNKNDDSNIGSSCRILTFRFVHLCEI